MHHGIITSQVYCYRVQSLNRQVAWICFVVILVLWAGLYMMAGTADAQITPSPDVMTHPEANEWAPLTPHHVPGLPTYLPPPTDYERVSIQSQWEIPPDKSVTLRQGTPVGVFLLRPLDTHHAYSGQAIFVQPSNTLYIGVDRVIEKTDTLYGTFEEVLPPVQGRNAVVKMRFTELHRPGIGVIPINAVLKGHDHILGGELTPGTEEKVVVHNVMGIGRYNQSTLGGRRAMGKHVKLNIGAPLTLVLESDITFPVWVGAPTGYTWQPRSGSNLQSTPPPEGPENSTSGWLPSHQTPEGFSDLPLPPSQASQSQASQYVRGNW